MARGYERFHNLDPTITRGDVRNAVRRAVNAYELGQWMQNPANLEARPVAKDYPNKPVADARSGRYEYRAVVRIRTPTGHFESLVIFQSRNRLTGSEVMDEARAQFWEETVNEAQYRRVIGSPDRTQVPDVFIVSATRMHPR